MSRDSLFHDPHGFTIIEMVVSIVVISIVGGVLFTFMTDKFVQHSLQTAQARLQQQTRNTLQIMLEDIKHAAGADEQNRWPDDYAPGAPGDKYSWQSDSDTLVLARPARDTSGDLLYQDPSSYNTYKDNIVYFVTSNEILKKRVIAADVPGNRAENSCPAGVSGCAEDIHLVNNVTSINIAYYNANDQVVPPSDARSVKITLQLQRDRYGTTISSDYTIRAVFRNE